MVLRRKRPGVPGCLGFDRLLWAPLYSYVRGNGTYNLRSPAYFSPWTRCQRRDHLECRNRPYGGIHLRARLDNRWSSAAWNKRPLDAVDGTIAREFAAATPLGGILDLGSDRVVEIAVIIGISWRRPELYLPALILTGSWYLNITVFLATGAALERPGPKLIDYPPGLVERTELIIFFVLLAMLLQFGPWLCYAYTGLELITAAQRLLFARRMLSGKPKP